MSRRFRWLLAVCAVLGLTGRLWNLDFDQRQHLHPDERFWSITSDALDRAPDPPAHGSLLGPALDWLDGARSPSNPYRVTESFLYGPISLAMARTTSSWLYDGVTNGTQPANAIAHAFQAVGVPLLDESGAPRFDDRYEVDLVGRLLGAIIDTLTLVVIGLIGRRLGGELAGLVAALLYAGSVLAIQYSHFLGSEPLLGLGCALTLLAALRLDRSADWRRSVRSGVVVGLGAGLAMAAKLNAVGLVAVPIAGCVALLVRHRRRSDLLRLGAVGLGSVLAFRLSDPSAFDGLSLRLSAPFRADLHRAASLRDGSTPPSFQWVGRVPIVQPLVWMATFAIGPGVMLAALSGAVVITLRLFGVRIGAWLADRRPSWAPQVGQLVHRGAGWMTEVGLWPSVMLLGGVAVPFLYVALTAFPTMRYFYPILPALFALAGLGVAAATRAARRTSGSRRAVALVVPLLTMAGAAVWCFGFVAGVYGQTHTRIQASKWIAANVPPGSVLSSEAWDDGLPLSLPGVDRAEFGYVELNLVGPDDEAKVAVLAEQLGGLDYVVESSPRIWGSVLRMPARFPSTIKFFDALDTGSLGYERVATFGAGIRIGPWHLHETNAEEAFSVYDHPEVRIWKRVRTVERDALIRILDPDAAASAVPVDVSRGSANGLMLFDRERALDATGPTYDEAFATRGSGLFHALGWFLVLELIGAAAFTMFLPLFRRMPDAGLGLSKVLALVVLSVAIFVAVTWLHLTLDRSLVAMLTTAFVAAGIRQGWRSRNLLGALWNERRRILLTVEILGASCFWLFVGIRARNPDLWHPYRGGEKPFELALLTAVLRTRTLPVYDPWFSGGALNYYYGGWFLVSVPARLLRTAPTLVMNLALAVFAMGSAGSAFSVGAALSAGRRKRWRPSSPRSRVAIVGGSLAAGFVLLLANSSMLTWMWQRVTGSGAPGPIDWWSLSRVIPDSVAVTEFPAWSFMFGDVHPHVMGIAVLLAVGGLCIGCYDALVRGRTSHAFCFAVLLGGGIGLVRMTNTWDFPLAAGLVGLTGALAFWNGARWRTVVMTLAVAAAILLVVYAPYVDRGEVFDAGFDPAVLRTIPSSWLKQFGFFAAVSAAVVLSHLSAALATPRPGGRRRTRAHLVVVLLSLLSLGYTAARPEFGVFQLTASLAAGCAWLAWHRHAAGWRSTGATGLLVMAIGWLIQAGVEMQTVRNDAGRMNTVFKFWYQSWIVLAVGAAVVITGELRARRGLRRTALVAVAVAGLTTVGFWAIALPVRQEDRISGGGTSLDGEAYLRAGLVVGAPEASFAPGDDRPLIDWLRANVRGIHPIAEAPGADYQWASRISWSTGLPTPIGWPYHETQQRRPYGALIEARTADMTSLYTTSDEREMARVLARYSIAYVVFGTQEDLLASDGSARALRGFECLTVMRDADRSTGAAGEPRAYFVATVDPACVENLRPLPKPPPPPS